MRINMGEKGRASSSLSANGGTMLGSLILANGPSQPLEAATKYYVDTVFGSLNANNILIGTLPITSLPVFTGDAINTQGSNSFTLINLGVTPGVYTKVIVDAKGRVTGNDVLSGFDIPNFDWSKVTNKPTTIAGYGITDALLSSGGNLAGSLAVGSPTQPLQVANKYYVDSALSGNSASTGDIIRKPFTTTPVGFLRCNGAMVDKSVYPELYAIIGDNFSVNTSRYLGQPWKQQYQFNLTQSSDINNWTTGTSLPGALGTSQVLVTNARVYLFGGTNGSGTTNTVYTAPINTDGTLGAWSTGTALPAALGYSSLFVLNNTVYLCGGFNGSAYTNIVYQATIDVDGTIGTWTTGVSLPEAIGWSQVVVTKKAVHLLGGYTGSVAVSKIYTADIGVDGSIGAWYINAATLPTNLAYTQCIVTKNRIYLIGGYNGTAHSAAIYTTTISNDGTFGQWISATSLPAICSNAMSICTRNRVYIIGGYNGSAYVSTVYTAPINTDGTIGTWSTGSSISAVAGLGQVISTHSRIYVLGGSNLSGHISTVQQATFYGGQRDYSPYYANINTNTMTPGSGRPWEQQYMMSDSTLNTDINGWLSDNPMPAATRDLTVAVTKNYVYILGGYRSAGTNAILKAPINSNGSLGTWVVDSNTLPVALYQSQVIVTKNRVYLIGGSLTSGYTSAIYSAQINSDGTLGVFGASGNFPTQITNSASIVTQNRVYIIGGYNGSAYSNAVYTTTINNDGLLDTNWVAAASLPGVVGLSTVFVCGKTLYVCGGTTNGTTMITTVFAGILNSSGIVTRWYTGSSLVSPGVRGGVFVSKNRVYIFAGLIANNTVGNIVQTAIIYADGNIGAWSQFTNHVISASGGGMFATKNTLYYVGGFNGSVSIDTVYKIAIPGGSNDYSPYYDGTYLAQIPNYLMPGSGRPWEQQYQDNTTQSTDITSWATSENLPVTLSNVICFATKNKVFACGGFNGTTAVNTVYSAIINSDGTLGTWTAELPIPGNLHYGQAVVTKNRVYILGGIASNSTNVVYTCGINSDGTLGTWGTGTALPASVGESSVFYTKNRVYLLGGYNGSAVVSTVYTAPVNTDGTLGAWTTGPSLPAALSASSAVVTNNRVYLLGGRTAGGSHVSTVYSAAISSSGTIEAWSTETSILGSIAYASVFVCKNKIYLFGGYNGSSYLSTVYVASISASGFIGAWSTGTPMTNGAALSTSLVTNGHMYLIGGRNGSGSTTNAVNVATISGGVNDYSAFYDGTKVPLAITDESNYFALPDFTNRERNGSYLYMKS